MLKSPLLFAIGVLVSLLSWTANASASADSLALSFALPPTSQPSASHAIATNKIDEDAAQPDATEVSAVEMSAAEMSAVKESEIQPSPATSDNAKDDIGVSFAATTLALPVEQDLVAESDEHVQLISRNQTSDNPPSDNLRLNPLTADNTEATALAFAPTTVAYDSLGLDDWIFEGGSSSLVAHTVGSAEGTRQWNGQRTNAYYGHKDPGNGVWNLGTFSYQHGARTPEEADKKQLLRLKRQGLQLEQQATHIGISLSLEEKLNGLDLANQAPLAALGKGGYIERLDQAYRMQMTGFEAISWARTRAYIDPNTQAWNAPGLGNNLHSISQDQERRMAAINKALRAYNRDDTTVRALAKFDSISLESPSIESDELSRWDIHLTSDASGSQEDELAAIAPPTPLPSTPSGNNSPEPLHSHRTAAKVPSKDTTDTARLTASLSTLSFGLPPSEVPNAAAAQSPTKQPEPLETESLATEPPSLDRLLTSAHEPFQSGLALQFENTEVENTEEITRLPSEEDRLINDAPSLITTEPSTALAQIAGDDKSPLPPAIPSQPNEEIENLRRFEDPIALGPVAAKLGPVATKPNHQNHHEATTSHKVIETAADSVQTIEENPEDTPAESPSNQSRWRIRIEDRVIDRK